MATEDSTGAKPGLETESSRTEPEDASLDPAQLNQFAANPNLSEDQALSLLKRLDLAPGVLEQLGKNGSVLRNNKVKVALVEHPRTPRHVSIPLIRQLYTFDLMQVALTPAVPADIKRAADEALCNRLETLPAGERLTLAHRGSSRIAEVLLSDKDARIVQAALQNSRLTETSIVRRLMRADASAALVEAVCHHAEWSLRREVRVALLRNENTPLARAAEFAHSLPVGLVRDLLQASRLPENVRAYLLNDCDKRVAD